MGKRRNSSKIMSITSSLGAVSRFTTEMSSSAMISPIKKFYRKAISSKPLRIFVSVTNFVLLAIFVFFIIEYCMYFKAGRVLEEEGTYSATFFTIAAADGWWSRFFLIFRFVGDAGIEYNIDMLPIQRSDRVFFSDTAFGRVYGLANSITEETMTMTSHTCECISTGDSTTLLHYNTLGVSSIHCKQENDTQTCKTGCILNSAYGFADDAFFAPMKLDESLQTRCDITEDFTVENSLGFGVTYIRELVESTKISLDKETIELKTKATFKHGSNSNQVFPWQDLVLDVFFFVIVYKVLCRSSVLPVLWSGVPINTSVLTVLADLVGSMVTTPAFMITTLFTFVIATGDLYFFNWFSPYPTPPEVYLQNAIQLACVGALILQSLASIVGVTLVSSGSIILFLGYCWTLYFDDEITEKAIEEAHSAGIIFERICTFKWSFVFDRSIAISIPFNCSLAGGAGLSGLEVFFLLKLKALTMLVVTIIGVEIAFVLSVYFLKRKMRKRRSTMKSIRKKKPKTAVKVSSFEKCLLFSGLTLSRFCRLWSAPLMTQFGNFYTVSAMMENEVILWGPVLINLDLFPVLNFASYFIGKKKIVFFVIQQKLYTGVLVDEHTLATRKEQGRLIPKFAAEYDYSTMRGINSTPLK